MNTMHETIAEHHRQIGRIADALGIPYDTDSPTKLVSQIVEAAIALKTQFVVGEPRGPTTHNVPTGAGDFDIVCDGCAEAVPEPHSWAQCTDGLRKRLSAALDAMVGEDRARDVEREACSTIALDIMVGNTELPTNSSQESKEWRRCAEFIYDEIQGRR